MKSMKITLIALCSAVFFLSSQANALECSGFRLNDNLAAGLLDNIVAGKSVKLTKRKRLVVRGVDWVSGTNCNITTKLNVKLKRKIRRDATGSIKVGGQLYMNGGDFCIKNMKVKSVNLSHTTGLGESIYKWVANKVIPNNTCL